MEHAPEVKRHCAEAYLTHIRSINIKISTLQGEIDERREQLDGVSAIRYCEQVTSSQVLDSFEQSVCQLQELIADYVTELAAYVDEQREAHCALSRLERPEHEAALTAYYLHARSWEQVCVDMDYTWQGMMSLRKKALESFYDVMPEVWRRQAIPNAMM